MKPFKPLIKFKRRTFLIPIVLGCFGLLRGARATDLDGVLPGGKNADGFRVLTHLTTGVFNAEHAAQMQKVTAQIEVRKAAPRTVLNDQ
jgi:hypothetical protein